MNALGHSFVVVKLIRVDLDVRQILVKLAKVDFLLESGKSES